MANGPTHRRRARCGADVQRPRRALLEQLEIRVLCSATNLPAPWQDGDVGSVALTGTASSTNSASFTVTGGGADIWNSADAFHFAYQPITGDATIVAQLTGEQNTNSWAKAGLMVRSSLAANAAEVSLVMNPGNTAQLQWRSSTGQNSSAVDLPGTAGEWLKLVRTGGTIVASISPDGTSWTSFKSVALPAGPAFMGLAVTAHNNARLNTASFAEVSTTVAPPPPPPQAPGAPLLVGSSSSDALLSWSAPATGSAPTSYTILREGPGDSDFEPIGTTTSLSFDDTTVSPGAVENYVILANGAGGSSDPSVSITVTIPAAGPTPWSDTDIGTVGLIGSGSVLDGGASARVAGSGADIWNSTDAFNFEYQPLVGNGSIVAQVDSVANTNGWAKAGVMIRESLNDDARNVMIALTPSNGVTFQSRTATHNTTVNTATKAGPGEWVELTRSGSTFTASISTDGLNWTVLGTATIPMVNNVLAGLCVTAHNSSKICAATFSHVMVTTTEQSASDWTDAAPAPMNRWEAQSFTWDNQLYVFGGFIDPSLDATAECDVYDPVANHWSALTTVPTGALTHAGVALVGDTVYFAGGDLGTFTYGKTLTATAAVLSYNLDTNTWGTLPSLPVAESCGGFVAIDDTLYYFGGINSTDKADLSTTYALNLDNLSAGWTSKAAMPDARNHIGYAAIDGIAYAIGGQHLYNESGGNDAQVDAYDPTTNTWTAVATLPQTWSSFHVSTLVIDDKIVIVGGQTNGGYDGIYQNRIEEYDPTTNLWSAAGTIPEANEGLAAAYINGQLILVGGTVDNHGGWAQDQTWIDSLLSF